MFKFQESDFDEQGNLVLPSIKEVKDADIDEFRFRLDQIKQVKEGTKVEYLEELWQVYQRLTPQQQSVLSLLVSGNSIAQTALKLKIDRSTIHRWMLLEVFTDCLKQWQKQLFYENIGQSMKLYQKAIDKLGYVLDNPHKYELKDYLKAIELCLQLQHKS